MVVLCFNPRARRGRDPAYANYSLTTLGFNPRARRGRDYLRVRMTAYTSGFNPRARRGRDVTDVRITAGGAVSIHAPAGGATVNGEA